MKKQLFTILLLCLFSITSGLAENDLHQRARKLHEKIFTIDTHCDTPLQMTRGDWDPGQRHDPGLPGSGKQDFIRMKEGGLDASFFAVYVGQGDLTDEGRRRAYREANSILDRMDAVFGKYPQLAKPALTPEDGYRLAKQGKRAIYLGMENGYPLGQDLSLIDHFYRRGIRYITLCHSFDNDICDSSTDRDNAEDNGLSAFGRKVVRRMNELGIMVDVSHISPRSFFDVLEVSQAPILASHSSVRAICDHPRNLSDEQLQALKKNGGVIQICIYSEYLRKETPHPEKDRARREFRARIRSQYGNFNEVKDPEIRKKIMQEYEDFQVKYPRDLATVKDAVDHLDHVVRLIGIDHVGIGTDFDGGGELADCRDVSQMPNITEELLRRGYSEKEIGKIWGGNAMRVFRNVIRQAKK